MRRDARRHRAHALDADFEKKMAVARRVMRRYRNALRELAK